MESVNGHTSKESKTVMVIEIWEVVESKWDKKCETLVVERRKIN